MYNGYHESGYKECHRCGNVQPLTVEFFYKYELKGFSNICLACSGKLKQIHVSTSGGRKKQQEVGVVKQPKAVLLFSGDPYADTSKMKECYGCGQTLSILKFGPIKRRHDGLSTRCRECVAKRARDYRLNNPELRAKRTLSTKNWQANNPDKVRELMRAATHRRRAKKKNLPSDFTKQDWEYALDYFHGCCAICGRQANDLFGERTIAADHFVPLSRDGGTIPENMIPLCHGLDGCNNKKRNSDPAQWLTATYGSRRANAILAKVELFFSTVRSSSREDKSA